MKEEKRYTIEDLPPMSKNEKGFWEKHNDEYYHYLYRINNKINGKYYYGIHSEKKDGIHKLGEDNYMGSGRDLIKAQKKEGIENFEKTIIKTFSTRDEARLEEFIVVDKELVNDPNCYNRVIGGGNTSLLGSVAVNYKDKNLREDNFFLVTKEEFYKNRDKYITHNDNVVLVIKKSDNNFISIPKEEYNKNPELYEKIITVNYKDENLRKDKYFVVTVEEYINNKDKYITTSSSKAVFKNKDNNSDIRMLDLDDPLVLSGQFIGITKGVKQSQETILKKIGEKNGNYGKMWITNGKENKKIKKEEKIPDGWYKGRVVENIIIKIKCINKNTLDVKYIEKDLVDCITWYPYIFYINNKLIDREEFLKVVKSSESWTEVSRKLNTYIDIIEKFRVYYNIPAETIISKHSSFIKKKK